MASVASYNPAVMAQRVEPNSSLDYFPTQPWGTRALCEVALPGFFPLGVIWEPSCGEGFMAEPLREYAGRVIATDVFDYREPWYHVTAPPEKKTVWHAGYPGQEAMHDFLWPGRPDIPNFERPDWCIFNPPFKAAEKFIHKARAIARVGVAALLRLQFLEGGDRYRGLYGKGLMYANYVFSERLPMNKNTMRKDMGTASAYAWFLFPAEGQDWGAPLPQQWIPPGTRARLERRDDYPTEVTDAGTLL